MNVWRDRLHRWMAPAARRCPLSPNALSTIALLLNVAAAALLYERWFLVAMTVLIAGGFLDAFDGIVARVQEKTSRYGDFLDHFFDRVSDVLLLTGWMFGNEVRIELLVAGVIGVLLNGYIGTQIEATWHERSYDTVGRGEFVLALVVYPIVSHILYQNGWNGVTLAALRIAEWMTVLIVVFAILGIVQRFALASKLERSK
jgi:phosphatidylglycerophosphate synthase